MESMRSRRTRTLAVITVTALTIGLAACSGGASDTGAPGGELTVWMKKQLLPAQNEAIKDRIEDFGEQNDVKVRVETIAYEDFLPKWSAALQSGDVPDVSYFGYQEVGQFFSQGVLDDVSDVVRNVEQANGPLSGALKKPVTFKGKQYGVPLWAEAQALYYRTDLFEAAGLTKPPGSWEDFRAYAQNLTGKGAFGAGIGYGKGNSDAEFFSRAVAWSYGGSFDASSQDAAGTEQGTQDAANLIRDVIATDKSAPSDSVGWDDAGNNRSYLGGQSAMVFNTGSLLATVKTQNPDLYGKTAVATFPAGPKGAISPGIANNLGIFTGSKNKDGARDLIAHLLAKDWYQGWTDKGAPLNIPVYDDLRKGAVWQDEKNQAFARAVDTFTFLGSPSPYSPAAGEIYNLRLVNDAFAEILVNNKPVPEVLSDLHSKVDKIYATKGN
jgi:multiple sugar transport system substrate-binding protein